MIREDCWLVSECNHCDCDTFCMRNYKLSYLYASANMSPSQMKKVVLYVDNDGTDTEAFKQLKEIETNIISFVSDGDSLYIHSTICGNGKTSWALRMIQAYFNKIWHKCGLECKALFINVPRLLLALKDNISEKSEYVSHIKENILNADLVVWDEVGSKGLSQFEHENILSFINARIDTGKSNIYTSNLSDEELHVALGDRLYSRIVNNSISIELMGADKRGLSKILTQEGEGR